MFSLCVLHSQGPFLTPEHHIHFYVSYQPLFVFSVSNFRADVAWSFTYLQAPASCAVMQKMKFSLRIPTSHSSLRICKSEFEKSWSNTHSKLLSNEFISVFNISFFLFFQIFCLTVINLSDMTLYIS